MQEVLLHIGYPKTGSTFLTDYFLKNPALHVERSAFDDYRQTGVISAQALSQPVSGKCYVISEEQLSVWRGELDIVGVRFKPYDIKAHQASICKNLYTLFPSAKILIVTRGFESAFRSMYWQYVSIGGTFALKEFQKNYSGYFADFFDYEYLIRLYQQVFGGKQVTVLPFELLLENSELFLATMEQQCGLPHITYNSEKINAALYDKTESYRMLSSFVYGVTQLFPRNLQIKIYGLYSLSLYKRKLSWLPNVTSSETLKSLEQTTMNLFRGKAEILRNNELFQPYLHHYIL